MRRALAAFVVPLLATALLPACKRPAAEDPVAEAAQRRFDFPVPTKDEVARVDGLPLSIPTYLSIRDQLRDRAQDKVLWVSLGALALRSDSQLQGKPIPLSAALGLARYAAGELDSAAGERLVSENLAALDGARGSKELRRRIDSLLGRAVVRKNEQALAQLRTL